MRELLFAALIVAAGMLDFYILPHLATAEGRPEVQADARVQDSSFFDLTARSLEGETTPLAAWQGQVALVVNVASRCGLTPQYEGLQRLHQDYQESGFVVLGFPSNDFLKQEPGTAAEIRAFCQTNYGITFPLFEKASVKGDTKSDIYRFLTRQHDEPNWNFTKYLIDRNGRVVQRFGPRTSPDDPELRAAIEKALKG